MNKLYTIKTWFKLKTSPEKLAQWVEEDQPYWDALRLDDPDAWDTLPPKDSLWLVTDEGALIQDTRWTAAAKTGAKKCFMNWKPDKTWLNRGQIVWGTAEEGFGTPRHGGGTFLHSISPLTFDPEVAYWLKGAIERKEINIAQKTWDGLTALHTCAAYGHASGIELLMQQGADPIAETKTGATPLEYAVKIGTLETARKLMSWGGWSISAKQKENVLKAVLSARAGRHMEVMFLKMRCFGSIEEWKRLRELISKKEVKYKDLEWARQIWAQEEMVSKPNREARRASKS